MSTFIAPSHSNRSSFASPNQMVEGTNYINGITSDHRRLLLSALQISVRHRLGDHMYLVRFDTVS